MMATLRLRYVHAFVDKTGRARYYFRYRGKRWALPGEPGTSEFTERYDALRRECSTVKPANNVAFGPGTVGFVIEKYLASGSKFGFLKNASGTQRLYRRTLDRLKEICGRALIADLREKHLREIRTRFSATSKADLAVTLMRVLWSFAKEELAMDLGRNPAEEIKPLHSREWSHQPWPEEVIEKFKIEAQPKPNAQLALALLLYTGQRASDVVRMRWDQYDGKGIQVRQLKTGTPLWIPCHSELKSILDDTERRSDFILTTRYGKGYSAHGLCGMIAAATANIGAKECSAHGLRCNAATALAEAECSVPQIMSITGHKTFKEAQRYASHAQQRKLGEQAISKWEVANSRTNGKHASG